MNIAQALKKAQHLLSEPRSGEILLAHVLKVSRAYLYTYPEKILTTTEISLFNDLIAQRQQGMPIAYLLGEKEFYSLSFHVTEDTLIPRPETEMLVDKALALLGEHTPCHVLELGTGSGAIAVTLAHLRPQWHITAVDISPAALGVAKQNAALHHVKIDFIQSNWFDHVPQTLFDLIISNPPYVAADDPHLLSLSYEPSLALTAGKDGLDSFRMIIAQASHYLSAGGFLVLEHGATQSKALLQLLENACFQDIQTLSDLGGLPRMTVGRKML